MHGALLYMVHVFSNEGKIHLVQDESTCISKETKISDCRTLDVDGRWNVTEDKIVWESSPTKCLTMVKGLGSVSYEKLPTCHFMSCWIQFSMFLFGMLQNFQLDVLECNSDDRRQQWTFRLFKKDRHYKPLEFSEEYHQYQKRLQNRFEAHGIH